MYVYSIKINNNKINILFYNQAPTYYLKINSIHRGTPWIIIGHIKWVCQNKLPILLIWLKTDLCIHYPKYRKICNWIILQECILFALQNDNDANQEV